jgi:hypothetical protein
MITLQEQIAEAKRELALRKNLYPQWVTRGTLDAGTAAYQLDAMEAILRSLMRLAGDEQQLGLFGDPQKA